MWRFNHIIYPFNNVKSVSVISNKLHVTTTFNNSALVLYKSLLRQCERLPPAPQKHYKFMVKQSFKQHVKETDAERIKQIMQRAHEDAKWILEKANPINMNNFIVPLATSTKPVSPDRFFNAVLLYHDRPELINRKLSGASILNFYQVTFNETNHKLIDIINYISVLYEAKRRETFTKESTIDFIPDLLRPYDKNFQIKVVTSNDLRSDHGVFIILRVLHPSHINYKPCIEVVVLHLDEQYVSFVCATNTEQILSIAPPFQYTFRNTPNLQLVVDIEHADSASGAWLAEKCFPKVLKWTEELDPYDVRKPLSLRLIDLELYFVLYRSLKEKYGKDLIEKWTEKTDPLKFVYEDLAIASYLICLWKKYSQESGAKPRFVDLGCGNGVLVYVLNQEGYPGCGVDVRKRKIWDIYPPETELIVRTIIPSDEHLFPNADWIIGNHSDELTPWIPLIAARSSASTRFFLLPCCCYDFDATKYIRKNPNLSQYAEYLQYVESIGVACGYHVEIDKLRIPSTKRTCLVSAAKTFSNNNEISKNLSKLFKHSNFSIAFNLDGWIENYKPRESVEKVRNCTQLDRSFLNSIVRKLMMKLLEIVDGRNKLNGGIWNAGGCLPIGDVITCLLPTELQELKSSCGGVQTLMRNHRYVFEVAKGMVRIRPPYLRSETRKYVDKPCWFQENHPHGCLHEDNICGYSHELRYH